MRAKSDQKSQQLISRWRLSLRPFATDGLTEWRIGDAHAGWVNPAMAQRMLASGLFEAGTGKVIVLSPGLGSPHHKTVALQEFVQALHEEGWIEGWRDENYDWFDHWGRRHFTIERAAFPVLGLRCRAVHINGYDAQGNLWLGRRADDKSVDPGRLDNLAAGGVASEECPEETLIRELQEEAGVTRPLARTAIHCGIIHSQRRLPHGIHDEMLFTYDLALPDDFKPENQDGEVASFTRMSINVAASRLSDMTVDAALVTANFIERRDAIWSGKN